MEKQKDKEEMKNKNILNKEFILNISISSNLLIICIWDRKVNIPRFPKNFLFLTQIDLYLNMIYYFICLFFNIKKKKIKEKYQIFFNFNVCISFVVFIMYWSMLIFDSKTLYKNTEVKVPFSLNLLLHGGIFIANLLKLILTNQTLNNTYIKMEYFLFCTVSYVGILYLAKMILDIKVYPFIYGSISKFFLVVISAFIVCLIGNLIYIKIKKEKEKIKKEQNYEELEMS